MNENSVNHKDSDLRHLLVSVGVGTLAITMVGFAAHSVGSRTDVEMNRLRSVESKYLTLKKDYAERSKAMEQFCNRMYHNWREMETRDKSLSPRQYQSRQFYNACLKRARGR